MSGDGGDDVVLWDVAEEHLDEAAFLLVMWCDALLAGDYTLSDVRDGPEARLLAHIDGLVVGGAPVAERLLLPAITEDGQEAERTAAAALALLGGKDVQQAATAITAAIAGADEERMKGLGEALGLSDEVEVGRALVEALRGDYSSAERALIQRALAQHRREPGPALQAAFQHDDDAVVQSALEIAAAVPLPTRLAASDSHLGSGTAETRDKALNAALTMGSQHAWAECLRRSETPTSDDGHALLLRALLGSAQEHDRLGELLTIKAEPEAVLWAAGFAGRSEHVDSMLAQLENDDDRVVKLAGEAFSAITGFEPDDDALRTHSEVEPEEGVGPGDGASEGKGKEHLPFEDEDLDADLVPDAADQLPLIEVAAARAWWAENRGNFTAGRRYLAGAPHDLPSIRHALEHGPARRRHAWALGLSIASRGVHAVSTNAFSSRQLVQMRSLATVAPVAVEQLLRR